MHGGRRSRQALGRAVCSEVEKLLQLGHSLLWVLYAVPDRPLVLVNFVVVAALVRLVAEEVDRLEVHTIGLVLVLLDVLQAVGLVPTSGEDVERDLTTDRVSA